MPLTDALVDHLDDAIRPLWDRFQHERTPERFLAPRQAGAPGGKRD